MPYNTNAVARQIGDSVAEAAIAHGQREAAVELAIELYEQASRNLVAWRLAVEHSNDRPRRTYASPVLPSDGVLSDHHPYPPRAPILADGYRVVATDSSFVAPDRHRGALCHLINVGRVMIQYGADAAAEIDSVPSHFSDYLATVEERFAPQGRALQAECAAHEMRHLSELADHHRPDIAFVDGTLSQTSLLAAQEVARYQIKKHLEEYYKYLAAFEQLGVPVVGYVSQTSANLVIRALAAAVKARMFKLNSNQEQLVRSFAYLDDADIFAALLDSGERSLIFEPWSAESDRDHSDSELFPRSFQYYLTYLRVGDEIVRVEFPQWAMTQFSRIHDLILSQCALGKGYPLAVDLAHQYAVLRNEDRESYFFLLKEMGLLRPLSAKARSKQAHGGNI